MLTRLNNVLIVDDDPIWGVEASRRLAAAGMNPIFHHGPFGTLHAIRANRCDAVIMDVNMPKLDGAVLARLIRSGLGRVPVLLCTNGEPKFLGIIEKMTGLPVVSKATSEAEFISHVKAALSSRYASARSGTDFIVPSVPKFAS